MVSRGPVWATGSTDRLQSYSTLRRLGVRIINAETPDDGYLRLAGYRQILTPACIAQIDLTRPDYLAAMNGKWRNRLRRAQSHSLYTETRPLNLISDSWLLEADQHQQRLKRFRNYPAAFTRAYTEQGSDAATLFLAYGDETPIAAMLFLNHAPCATYHIGWAGAEGRRLSAHNLLMAKATRHYSASGYQRLDLGQIDTLNAAGLARFKIGAGAVVRPLGGTWLRLAGCAGARWFDPEQRVRFSKTRTKPI